MLKTQYFEKYRLHMLIGSYFLFAGCYYFLCQLSFIIGWGDVPFGPLMELLSLIGFNYWYPMVWFRWFVGLIPLLVMTSMNMWLLAKILYVPTPRLSRLLVTCLLSVVIALLFIVVAGYIFYAGPNVLFWHLSFVIPVLWQGWAALFLIGWMIFPLVLSYLLLQASTVTEFNKEFISKLLLNPLFWIGIILAFVIFWISLLGLGQTLFHVVNDTTLILLFHTLPVTSIYIALIIPLFPLVVIGSGSYSFPSLNVR